jgi:hypothetical protein
MYLQVFLILHREMERLRGVFSQDVHIHYQIGNYRKRKRETNTGNFALHVKSQIWVIVSNGNDWLIADILSFFVFYFRSKS